MENILCKATKCLRFKKKDSQNTTTKPLRKLLWMGSKKMKFQQEDTFEHCSYSEEMLNYIHGLVHNDIKDEILENSCKVSLKEFCEAF